MDFRASRISIGMQPKLPVRPIPSNPPIISPVPGARFSPMGPVSCLQSESKGFPQPLCKIESGLVSEMHPYFRIGGSTMNCPNCKSENEMVFSVLSHGFLCQEADCGFEFEVDWHEAEVLLHPEEELVLA